MHYRLAADAVVVAHLAYVLFVILGLVGVFVGRLLNWSWVRNNWFRSIHLSMILIVVIESLLSITCPLTTWENYLRSQAGQAVEQGSFIGRLAHNLLFCPLHEQTFVWIYCSFGLLVLFSWILVPPRMFQRTVIGTSLPSITKTQW
jgi:hypothetical protein